MLWVEAPFRNIGASVANSADFETRVFGGIHFAVAQNMRYSVCNNTTLVKTNTPRFVCISKIEMRCNRIVPHTYLYMEHLL